MKLPFKDKYYCIDTSPLIVLKNSYARDIFPSLWKDFEALIDNRIIIAPREVFRELEQIADELWQWAKARKRMFNKLDREQMEFAQDIMGRFPNLVDPEKETPDADPFVISLARSENCTVITEERRTGSGPGGRPRIPNVCDAFGVPCLTLTGFFREQSWKY